MNANVDQGYRLLGYRFIRKQLDALSRHTLGARTAEDVEDVHQARVASRRLRAGLAMFENLFPAKQSQRWQTRIRKLTKGLGEARDRDVQILFLEKRIAQLTNEQRRCRPGIQRLHLRISQDRVAVQPRVVKVIDKLDRSLVLAEMVGEIARAQFILQSQAVGVDTLGARALCRDHIHPRIEALFTWENSLADATDYQSHHAMRIAAKKLRYTLEISNPAYGKELTDSIKAVKQIQTLLGDIHDCDVWVETLGRFIAEEYEKTMAYYGHDRPFRVLRPGLDTLREERQARRLSLFNELVTTWEQQKAADLWDRLNGILTSPAPSPSSPTPTDEAEPVHDEKQTPPDSPLG